VRACIRSRIAPEMKLQGYWGTEGVENEVDFESGRIEKEGRTDISYTWNNEHLSLELIFEFKKLSWRASSRKSYIDQGLQKFVSGIYSVRQPVALMVGILLGTRDEAVGGLRKALAHRPTAAKLRLCKDGDERFVLDPSTLFPARADFDTEHLRPADKAPAHGTIRVAHMFVEFPYAHFPAKGVKRRAVLEALDSDI